MPMKASPIVIFAHSRPEYLQKCLDSIGRQGLKAGEVHVWIDGLRNPFSGRMTGDLKKHAETIRVAENHPVVTGTNIAEENRGVAIQQYMAYENYVGANQLDSSGEWRFITFLDDDVILGKDYLYISELMVPWMVKDDRLFSVSPTFMRTVAADRIAYHLDTVEYGEFNWIGYTMDMWKWPELREHFQQYYDFVKSIDYAHREHNEIRKMIHANGWNKPHTSQDCGKDMALHLAGMRRLRCSVNRGYYIGELGVHGTPSLYQAQGWTDQVPYEHPNDHLITSLRLVEEGHTNLAVRSHYHTARRDMNAHDFFHKYVKRYVEPRAHAKCMQEIKAGWPKVERDANKIGHDVPEELKAVQDELAEAKDVIGRQQETITSLTQQLEEALNPPPKPIVPDGHHDPRDDEPIEIRD